MQFYLPSHSLPLPADPDQLTGTTINENRPILYAHVIPNVTWQI